MSPRDLVKLKTDSLCASFTRMNGQFERRLHGDHMMIVKYIIM